MARPIQSFLQRIWSYFEGDKPKNPTEPNYQSEQYAPKRPGRPPKQKVDDPPHIAHVRKQVLEGKKKISILELRNNSPLYPLPGHASFGDIVKWHRRKNKWNVHGFLKRLEIDNLPLKFVRSVEEYNYIPDPKTVERIAYVLGAPRKYMLEAAYKDLINNKDK
jgi:hypothetical protein